MVSDNRPSVGPAQSPQPSVREEAKRHKEAGRALVIIQPGSKIPRSRAWQNATPRPEDFRDGDNLGIQLGSKSGHLVDLDFDCPEARYLSSMRELFGALPGFRRSSYPAGELGHRLVICHDAPDQIIRFGFSTKAEKDAVTRLGLAKPLLFELRCGRGQTVVPPSKHGNDQLVAEGDLFNPPEMAWDDLRKRAPILAFAALAAMCYPPEGSRDQYCLLMAGALIDLGVDPEIAEVIVLAIAAYKGDDEPRGGKGRRTAARAAAGQAVTGLSEFLAFTQLEVCEKRIRSWFGQAPRSGSGAAMILPSPDGIDVNNPNLVQRTKQIEDLLLEKGPSIFRSYANLVRARKLDTPTSSEHDGVTRHLGVWEITPATPEWIAQQISAIGKFYRRGPNGRPRYVQPTPEMMSQLHHSVDERRFPPLVGITMSPTLWCDEPGYDPKSCLYLAFERGAFPPIPANPSFDDAREAIERFKQPLREFPFDGEAARSVALSGMLSAIVRGQLRTCPLHAFTAPAAGTGKTKIAEMIGLIATGVSPSAISYGPREEENEKRLHSLFRTGDPVILLDNISVDLEGDALCSALTQNTVQTRLLGHSEMAKLSTQALILATGNNLRISGDLSRRVVLCRLDAKVPDPEERSFAFDPVDEVRERRAQLVVDGLTILRAYDRAGRPARITSAASFPDWDLIRGALVWLGFPDPWTTRTAVKADNPELAEKSELFMCLLKFYQPGQRFKVSEMTLDTQKALSHLLWDNVWNPTRVGRLLSRHKDIELLGVTLRSEMGRLKVQEYWLEGVPDSALSTEAQRDRPL